MLAVTTGYHYQVKEKASIFDIQQPFSIITQCMQGLCTSYLKIKGMYVPTWHAAHEWRPLPETIVILSTFVLA